MGEGHLSREEKLQADLGLCRATFSYELCDAATGDPALQEGVQDGAS